MASLGRRTVSMFVTMWAASVPAWSAAPTHSQSWRFELERGPAVSVLEKLAAQARQPIITSEAFNNAQTKELGPLMKEATVEEALDELLEDTDLSYVWQDEQTIRVDLRVVHQPDAEDGVTEVVVWSTALPSRVEAPLQPYVVPPDARSAVVSRQQLASLISQQPFQDGSASQLNGAQPMQLRGLGHDATLLLINGRRVQPGAIAVWTNAFDLNDVPTAAVDRIEVLPDAGSPRQGMDAIGGAINVVLRKHIEHPEVLLRYGQAEGGAEQRLISLSLGMSDDRQQTSVVFDYQETDPLMGGERARWRDQDYRRFGGRDYRDTAADPGNVYSMTGQPLPGLTSSHAAIPKGAGDRLTLADFRATDGLANLKSSYRDWSISPLSRRMRGYATTELGISADSALFLELLFSNNEASAWNGRPVVYDQLIPGEHFNNPFGEPVRVNFSLSSLPPVAVVSKMTLARMVVGGYWTIGDWRAELTSQHHREAAVIWTKGDLDYVQVIAAINSDDPSTTLDPFSSVPGSQALLNSLIARDRRVSSFSSSELWSALLESPMFALGEGKGRWTIGAQRRRDSSDVYLYREPLDSVQEVDSVFSELTFLWREVLRLDIGARGDRYSSGRWSMTPRYQFAWTAAKQWTFHGTYREGFRSPSLLEAHLPVVRGSWITADPYRGGERSTVDIRFGGNPLLHGVRGRAITAGAAFKSSDVPSLVFDANYWRILIDHPIIAPDSDALLAAEFEFPGLVLRDTPSNQDLQMGWPGRLRALDLTRINFGSLQTSGVDFTAAFLVQHGGADWQFNLATTWVDEYRSRNMNSKLPIERVGIASARGTIPRWRTIGAVVWTKGAIEVCARGTFLPSYQDVDRATERRQGRVSSQFLLDLRTQWRLAKAPSAWLRRMTFTLGADNVLDQDAPYSAVGGPTGFDGSQHALTRRFVYFQLSMTL